MLKIKFKNLSLKKKMLLFYVFSIILPLIIVSIVIYTEMSKSMSEKVGIPQQEAMSRPKIIWSIACFRRFICLIWS